ncbi:hypothetical protein KEM52_003066, partial [Ascosphaera acerosa]
MPPPKRMRGAGASLFAPPTRSSDLGLSGRRRLRTIDFFVDSRDQIPDVNRSRDNPFYVPEEEDEEEDEDEDEDEDDGGCGDEEAAVESPSRVATKTGPRTQAPASPRQSRRSEDGMFYIFRGKKVFRKFEREEEDDLLVGAGAGADAHDGTEGKTYSAIGENAKLDRLLRGMRGGHGDADRDDDDDDELAFQPLSRATIKPRVLFPTKAKKTQRRSQEKVVGDAAHPQSSRQSQAQQHGNLAASLRTPSPELGDEIGEAMPSSPPLPVEAQPDTVRADGGEDRAAGADVSAPPAGRSGVDHDQCTTGNSAHGLPTISEAGEDMAGGEGGSADKAAAPSSTLPPQAADAAAATAPLAPVASTTEGKANPVVTPPNQLETQPPTTPRSLRPRGIKAYLNPIGPTGRSTRASTSASKGSRKSS